MLCLDCFDFGFHLNPMVGFAFGLHPNPRVLCFDLGLHLSTVMVYLDFRFRLNPVIGFSFGFYLKPVVCFTFGLALNFRFHLNLILLGFDFNEFHLNPMMACFGIGVFLLIPYCDLL